MLKNGIIINIFILISFSNTNDVDNTTIFENYSYVLSNHTNSVTSIIKLKNGNIVSASGDKSFIIWNSTNQYTLITKIQTDHSNWITQIIELDTILITFSLDSRIKIWESKQDYKLVKTIQGKFVGDSITRAIILSNGNILIGTGQGNLELMNKDFTTINTINAHTSSVYSIIELKSGLIATAAKDSLIKIWKIDKDFNLVHIINSGPYFTLLGIIQLDNGLLVGCSREKLLKIWNTYIGYKLVNTIQTNHTDSILKIINLENGYIATGADDGNIIVYDININQKQILIAHSDHISDIIQFDNGVLFSGSDNGNIKVWNPSDKYKLFSTMQLNHSGFITSVIKLKNGLIVVASGDKTIKVYSKDYNLLQTLTGHSNYVYCLAEINDKYIASGSFDSSVKIWDYQNGCIKTLTGHTSYISSIIMLSNGWLVTGSGDKTIKVWNIHEDYKIIYSFNSGISPVYFLLELNSEYLASSDNNSIKLWSIKDEFRLVRTLSEHSDWISCVIQLKNGLIISGSSDKSIKVWNPLDNYKVIQTIESHSSTVSSLVEINNGFASGSWDKSIKIWEFDKEYNLKKTLTGHTNHVSALININDNVLLSGSWDESLKIWKDYVEVKNIPNWQSYSKINIISLENGFIAVATGSGEFNIKILNPYFNLNIVKTIKVDSSKPICSLAQLDFQIIAAVTTDGLLKLYNNSYDLLSDIQTNQINPIILNIEFGVFLTASYDGLIKFWKYGFNKSPILFYQFNISLNISDIIYINERNIAISSENNIYIWKFEDKLILITKINTNNIIIHLALLKNNIISCSFNDKSLRFWDIKNNFKLISNFNTMDSILNIIQLDNGMIAASSYENNINIFDPFNNNQLIYKIQTNHTSGISGLLELSIGYICSASNDDIIQLYEIPIHNNKIQSKLIRYVPSDFICLTLLNNGIKASSLKTDSDNVISLWIESNNSISNLEGHTNYITHLSSTNSGMLLSGSANGSLRIWNPNTFESVRVIEEEPLSFINKIEEIGYGLIVSAHFDRTLRIYDPNYNYETIQILKGHKSIVSSILHFNSTIFLSTSYDKSLIIWKENYESEYKGINKIIFQNIITNSVLIKDDYIGLGFDNGVLEIYNINSLNKPICECNIHTKEIISICRLENDLLATGSSDNTIRIWKLDTETKSCNLYKTLISHTDGVYKLIKLKNGNLLSASRDGFYREWYINNIN